MRPSLSSSISSFAIVSVSLFASFGCGDGDNASALCNAMADKSVQCDKNFKKDKRGAMVAACVAMAREDSELKADLVDVAACTKKDSCEDFAKCRRAVREQKAGDKIAKGKPSEIADDCRYLDKDAINDGVRKACSAALVYELDKASKKGAKIECYELKGLAKRFGTDAQKKQATDTCGAVESAKVVAELDKLKGDPLALAKQCDYTSTKKFTAAVKKVCELGLKHLVTAIETKTAAGVKAKFDLCYRAKSLAKKFGADREKSAKNACATNEVAGAAKSARDKAAANVAAKTADMPWECQTAIKKLDKLADSEWKTKTKEAVIKSCYVDLGIVVAENLKSNYSCHWRVKRIIKGAGTYKLLGKHPALLAALQKQKRCAKQIKAAQAL